MLDLVALPFRIIVAIVIIVATLAFKLIEFFFWILDESSGD